MNHYIGGSFKYYATRLGGGVGEGVSEKSRLMSILEILYIFLITWGELEGGGGVKNPMIFDSLNCWRLSCGPDPKTAKVSGEVNISENINKLSKRTSRSCKFITKLNIPD